jgi:hypothetical protein
MKARNWLLLTAIVTLAVALVNVLVNVRLDIYGLFRDTHGRHLGVIENDRRTKFLLSERYVPENFNGVLIGSSVSNNWNTSAIRMFRVYNESIDGGNISEEKLLIEKVLRKSALKLAICVVHPYMTESHGFKSQEMTEREYWGALGSKTVYRTYRVLLKGSASGSPYQWDEFGAAQADGPRKLDLDLQKMMEPGTEFHVDSEALADYRALVDELRRQGARLTIVVPPTYTGILQPKRQAFARYLDRVMPIFSPEDSVIDFNAPEYGSLVRDPQNFRDGVHFSRQGAAKIIAALNERLQSSVDVMMQ